MDFCIISPIVGLKRYSALGHTHLLLPQLSPLPGYMEFYNEMTNRGDFIILDNGAYEGQSNWKALVQGIFDYEPNVVVLPDYLLQDWKKTWREATKFLDSYYYLYPKIEWMYVPQAEPGDIIGFIDGLFHALDDERITWIGLPRALTYAITTDLYMRVRVAEQIHKRRNVKLHALGMAKGSLDELNALNKIGCVSSIDSNAPVWRGWNDVALGEPWNEIPCDYQIDHQPNMCEHQTILDNLKKCGVSCSKILTSHI